MASVVPNMVVPDSDGIDRTTCENCGDSNTEDWSERSILVVTKWFDEDSLSSNIRADVGGENPIAAIEWESRTVYECPDCVWYCFESELNNADPYYDEDGEEEQEGWKCTNCESVYDEFAEAVRCCP
jgi:hypothetical protein